MTKMEGANIRRRRHGKLFLKILGILFFVVFALNASGASAASLFFSPSSGNFSEGNIFTMSALVNTGGVAINNAEGVISFPASLLEVVSVSKSGSIFSLWVEDPSFSNGAGTISFNGGLPTPGFNGTAGKIISAVFRVKRAGTATVAFSSGAVRANDGFGTNVLSVTAQAQFSLIVEETPVPPVSPAPPTAAPSPAAPSPAPVQPTPTPGSPPSAPVVTSDVFQDENLWYSDSNPTFKWQLPGDVTGVSLMLTDAPNSNPGYLSDGLMEEYTVEDVQDGIWYFHIKFRNEYGWGTITHRKVLVDTKDPELFKTRLSGTDDPTNPSPAVHFITADELSGVAYYDVKVDGRKQRIAPEGLGQEISYTLPPQSPGYHSAIVTAYDGAGNSTVSASDFIIKAIVPPVIEEYPSEIETGIFPTIRGTFVPGGIVTLYLKKDGEEPIVAEVETGQDEIFSYRHEQALDRGTYKVWAEGIDGRGAKSDASPAVTITVKLPTLFRIGQLAIDYLSIVVTLIAIIALIVGVVVFAWYRVSLWRVRTRREVREAEESVQKAFDALYEDIRDNLEELESVKTEKELSREEKKLLKNMKGALDVAERYIGKEMKDVEKELE